MTYREFIRGIEILAEYSGDSGLDSQMVLSDWAEHSEYGFSFPPDSELSVSEIRELRNLGWLLGSSLETPNEDAELWDPDSDLGKNISDSDLLELWDNYKSIYKYA